MTDPDFAITVAGSPEHPVVEVSGEIDHRNGLALAERVDGLLDGQPSHLTLDLSGLPRERAAGQPEQAVQPGRPGGS